MGCLALILFAQSSGILVCLLMAGLVLGLFARCSSVLTLADSERGGGRG